MKTSSTTYDAIVVGSGPNGLAAAVRMALAGKSVKVFEASSTIGGGTRTLELTEPGFYHDICSAVHPTAMSSPFLKSLPLQDYGLEWVHPEYPLVHPLDNGEAAVISVSLEETAEQFGRDSKEIKKLYTSFSEQWDKLTTDIFAPFRLMPNNPLLMAKFGWYGLRSAKSLADSLFKEEHTKTYFAGLAGHSILPLTFAGSGAFGLVLGASLHSKGWPVAKHGSHTITKALASYLESLGGEIEVNAPVNSLSELPKAKTILLNTSPKGVLNIAGDQLPSSYVKKLQNYTYGPGVFKIDYALNEPVPWTNSYARKAGTLHIGSSMEEITLSEDLAWNGKHAEKPYLIASQPSIFDDTRAPEGKHTFWVYCHVPNGSDRDMTAEIESQIERYAPGFKDTIISKCTNNTSQLESYNANYVGGDINTGAAILTQLFTRPAARLSPYTTPLEGVYICSSATPPGGGVHGMCGYHAAEKALKTDY